MNMYQNVPLGYVPHPGETLKERLDELGMSYKEFAARAGKPEKTIIDIIEARSSVTPDMAVAFEKVLMIPVGTWLNLQSLYDEFKAREKKNNSARLFSKWTKGFPLKDMLSNGWIREIKGDAVNALLQYFGVSSPKGWETFYMKGALKVAFRLPLEGTQDPYALSAWLRQGEIQAMQTYVEGKYSPAALRKVLPLLRAYHDLPPQDMMDQISETLSGVGVKIFFTKGLPGISIKGATRWIYGHPCIQMLSQVDEYENFWFTLFHEIGHILLHGKKDIYLEAIEYKGKRSDKEAEADAFATRAMAKFL